MPTVTEKIALVVYPIWTYYRQELCCSIRNSYEKSLPAKISTKKTQQILDVFPHMDRVQAAFLALIADIISVEEINITPEDA